MIQELLLITQELKPLTLTLWDQFVPSEGIMITNVIDSWPVVLATRLKFLTFNGLSLSTKSTSFLMLNPDIPKAPSLRSWSADKKETRDNIIVETPPPKRTKRMSPTKDTIIDISTATRTLPTEAFWIKAMPFITDFKQACWYIGCNNCYKTIYADCGKIYNCLLCNQHEVMAKPRCRLEVGIHDATGTIKATCLGHNAEKLFSITAAELKERTNEDGLIDESYLKSITPTQTLLIKQYDNHRTGTSQQKLTIVALEDEYAENDLSGRSEEATMSVLLK